MTKVIKETKVIEGEFVGKETAVEKTEIAIIVIEGLIKIPENEVVKAFSDNKKLNAFVKTIKKKATSKVNNLKTDAGRKDIASRAHKVSKMKTALNKVLDTSLEDAKSLISKAGQGKKYLTAELDKLKAEIRKPLTDWENAEKEKEEKRIEAIQALLKGIDAIGQLTGDESKDDISELIEAITSIDCENGFDEFAQDALQAKSAIKEKLSGMLNDMIQKELEDQQRKELAAKELELENHKKANELKEQAQQRLNKLMMTPVDFMGKSVFEIETKINKFKKYVIEESEFGELYETAKQSVLTVITQLEAMATNQKIVEQAQAQQAEQIEKQPFHEEEQEQLGDQYLEEQIQTTTEQINEPVTLANELSELNDLTENLAEENQQPVQKRVIGGYREIQNLTPQQKLIKQVEFWANNYSAYIYGSTLSDLENILNKYK